MGGEGPINFTKEDYYALFSFDKAIKIDKLNKKVKKQDKELEVNQKYILDLEKKYAKLEKQYKELEKQYNKLEKKYSNLVDSKAWRAITFYRRIKNRLKKLIQNVSSKYGKG